MLIELARQHENDLSTAGRLSIGKKVPYWITLEDGFRDPKVPGETRIPPGRYQVKLRTEGGLHAKYLTRFGPEFHKGMLWLQDVPDFTFVYLHIGNDVEETDGCILVGSTIVGPTAPGRPYTISKSEAAYRDFYPRAADAILAGEDVFLEVRDRAPDPAIA